MGRNIWSVCHECKSRLMHFRGQESDNMQAFQKAHSDHESMTEIFSDYVKEAPEEYKDLHELYNQDGDQVLKLAHPKTAFIGKGE